MSKQELLKKLHDLAWVGRTDLLGGDALEELQDFIVKQIEEEEASGTMRTRRLDNGHMAEIQVVNE